MKIVNGKGEEMLTPKSERKEQAKKELKALKDKGKPSSISELATRIEKIERILDI